MKQLRRTGEMDKLSRQRNNLRDDRCPGRAFDSPVKAEDKDRVQHTVDHDRSQFRETGRT